MSTLESRTPTLEPQMPTLEPQMPILESQTTTLEPHMSTLETQTPILETYSIYYSTRLPTLEPQMPSTLVPRTSNDRGTKILINFECQLGASLGYPPDLHLICPGFDIPSESTTNWRCWSIDASTDWRRVTSPTSSRVCRRLSRDGIFGQPRRPVSSCLVFSERHSVVVHSLWQRLKHGTAYRHMSHHHHRWRHSNAISRLSCS